LKYTSDKMKLNHSTYNFSGTWFMLSER